MVGPAGRGGIPEGRSSASGLCRQRERHRAARWPWLRSLGSSGLLQLLITLVSPAFRCSELAEVYLLAETSVGFPPHVAVGGDGRSHLFGTESAVDQLIVTGCVIQASNTERNCAYLAGHPD